MSVFNNEGMDFLLIVFLTALNGLFAMSEMAVAMSRKARLQAMAEAGDKGARAALALQEHPTRFLSTVQVGITSIGVLNGIIGEAAFSDDLALWLQHLGLTPKMAGVSATAGVVTIITFVTIVFGELVPKRIGQMFPETVARWIAPTMHGLAQAAAPFVKLLSVTTQGVLKLVGLDRQKGPVMTHEEIAASLAEGVDAGLIEEHEHQMVRNVFHLDDRVLTSLMTPRTDIIWFDAQDSVQACLQRLGWMASRPEAAMHASHSWYPVCKVDLDNVVGVVGVNRLLAVMHAPDAEAALAQSVQALCQPATFVPETLSGMELLEQFRQRANRIVFVVDEYGSVQGLLTPRDLLEGIAGELHPGSKEQAWAIEEADGSWTLDGLMPVSEFKARLDIGSLPDEDKDRYNTLAGLLMNVSGRLPQKGEVMEIGTWQFTVERLQGKRLDVIRARKI
jgi:putative hemolysin